MKEQVEYVCVNCGDSFVRDAGRPFKYCSRKCAAENKARIKRLEAERQKRLKEYQTKNPKNINEMAREGVDLIGGAGNYGNKQVQETLAMYQVDWNERVKEIRKSWKK